MNASGDAAEQTFRMIIDGTEFVLRITGNLVKETATMLYAISQTHNGRVTNNCNMSEDWIGYSTRYGDSVGDFAPICNLTVTEVRAIGHAMGIPAKWVDKTPDDGLPGSSPDEVKFGFTYDLLDKYIRDGVEPENKEIKDKIDAMHKKNLFKLRYMDCFEYKPE